MTETLQTPGIVPVTIEEDAFEIAVVRAGVTGEESCKSAAMGAILTAIHPPGANSINES